MSNLASTALLVLRTSSTVSSHLLSNLLHPSTGTPCDFHLTRLAIRILVCMLCLCHSSMFVLAASSCVQALRTPGQDLNVRRTLVSHSATCLLSMNLHICHPCCIFFFRRFKFRFFARFQATHMFDFHHEILCILDWSRLHATIVLQVFFPLATAHLLSLGHLHCIGFSMLLCCTWFLNSAMSFHQMSAVRPLCWYHVVLLASSCSSSTEVTSPLSHILVCNDMIRSSMSSVPPCTV